MKRPPTAGVSMGIQGIFHRKILKFYSSEIRFAVFWGANSAEGFLLLKFKQLSELLRQKEKTYNDQQLSRSVSVYINKSMHVVRVELMLMLYNLMFHKKRDPQISITSLKISTI